MDLASLLLAESGSEMTSFFSLTFLFVFLPVCLIVYAAVPKAAKKYILLLASFVFCWLVSGVLIIYLILTVISVFLFGKWLDNIQTKMRSELAKTEKEKRKALKQQYVKKQRAVLLFAVILHIGLLLALKYQFSAVDIEYPVKNTRT